MLLHLRSFYAQLRALSVLLKKGHSSEIETAVRLFQTLPTGCLQQVLLMATQIFK